MAYVAHDGVPRKIHSDQGSAYKSHEFIDFSKSWAIDFTPCSGEYPQGNGMAEAAVELFKKWITGTETPEDRSQSNMAPNSHCSGQADTGTIPFGQEFVEEIVSSGMRLVYAWK